MGQVSGATELSGFQDDSVVQDTCPIDTCNVHWVSWVFREVYCHTQRYKQEYCRINENSDYPEVYLRLGNARYRKLILKFIFKNFFIIQIFEVFDSYLIL